MRRTAQVGRRAQATDMQSRRPAAGVWRGAGRRELARAPRSSEGPVSVVTGDIGGTNARLSVWRCDGARHEEVFHKTYQVSQYDAFDVVLDEFLAERPVMTAAGAGRVAAAALAVAGAVDENRCAMTNTPWVIDGAQLSEQFSIASVAVLNDFEAVGYGVAALSPADVVVVNKGSPEPRAPKVVMGPGTGLGAAQLFYDSGAAAYQVVPGEGAHATFAPRGWRQAALAAWVADRVGHCEIEEVACGRGLELIYEFLLSDDLNIRPEDRARLKKSAPEITALALDETPDDPRAVEAVDIFLAIVGAEAGAMGLRCLAKGGVYIAGGIIPRLMKRLGGDGGVLKAAFVNRAGRERFHRLLTETPLYVVTNTKVGIIGSREYALRLVKAGGGGGGGVSRR